MERKKGIGRCRRQEIGRGKRVRKRGKERDAGTTKGRTRESKKGGRRRHKGKWRKGEEKEILREKVIGSLRKGGRGGEMDKAKDQIRKE